MLRSESTAQQKVKRPDQQPCSKATEISLAWTIMSNFISNVYIDPVSPNSILGHTMQQDAFVYTRTLYNTSYIYTQESLIFGIFLQSQIQLGFLEGKKKKKDY